MNFDKIKELIRPNILNLAPYSSARDEFTEKAEVYLDANENPNENGFNRYPDSHHEELRTLLTQQKSRRVEPNQLVLGNGSDEIIDMVVRMFCEPNIDNIIITPPTYGMYEVVANINAISIKKVYQLPGFRLDVEGIIKQVDVNTKIIFICSPNNPSGNAFPKEDILKIIETVPCMIFLDEAYIDFSDESSFTSLLSDYPNLIIGQTLSKFYGLAGLRIGMGIASKEIIAVLNKIKPPYNINSLSQKTAMNELKNIDYDHQLALIKAERMRLIDSFEELKCIEEIFPTDANFVLIKVSNATDLYNYLVSHSVIVRNRSTQYLCDNCLRITIGLPHENDRLINLVTNYNN